MKVLKTPLARQVLADPKARDQLRAFLAARGRSDVVIELQTPGGPQRLRPVMVPRTA